MWWLKRFISLFGKLFIILSLFFISRENKGLATFAEAATADPNLPPYIVVIDPGHGGADGGTYGGKGKARILEKNVSLGIALRLEKELNNPKFTAVLGRKIKVMLTRYHDHEVSLDARSDLAHKTKADLFVSIHANSSPDKKVEGVETYFLDNTSGESNSKIEEIENKTSKKYAKAPPASIVLRSVAADAMVDSSRKAAQTIHRSLVTHLQQEDISFRDRGVKQAMFYVLLDAQVPAVLIEAFYLSNAADAALVREAESRQKIAEGIAKGILRYLVLL